MIRAQGFLDILKSSCESATTAQIARASVTGKNEAIFRDLALNALARVRPDWLCRAEWDTPKDAFARWSKAWPAEKRRKGIVDLVAVSADDPFSESPVLAVEFKMWYWFDAIDKSKYARSGRDYHHLISQSFVMDATKLVSVIPDAHDGRLVVTIVPTFHLDEIQPKRNQKRGEYLAECGFPKSYVGLAKADPKAGLQPTTDLRTNAIIAIHSYFESKRCPTVVGAQQVGVFNGLRVTTDFLVSEVPKDLERR